MKTHTVMTDSRWHLNEIIGILIDRLAWFRIDPHPPENAWKVMFEADRGHIEPLIKKGLIR